MKVNLVDLGHLSIADNPGQPEKNWTSSQAKAKLQINISEKKRTHIFLHLRIHQPSQSTA